jgi:hypothetical protein
MKKLLRVILPSAIVLGGLMTFAVAQGMFNNFPFASSTASGRNAATIPMTGSECIPGDTRLTQGLNPATSCYTQGNIKGNYLVTVTDGATIAPDFSTNANVYKVTLGGNRTLAWPSSVVTGQTVMLLVTQDTTGSRTLTWSSGYNFAGSASALGSAPTLTTTGGLADLFQLTYTGNRIQVVGPASQGRTP